MRGWQGLTQGVVEHDLGRARRQGLVARVGGSLPKLLTNGDGFDLLNILGYRPIPLGRGDIFFLGSLFILHLLLLNGRGVGVLGPRIEGIPATETLPLVLQILIDRTIIGILG